MLKVKRGAAVRWKGNFKWNQYFLLKCEVSPVSHVIGYESQRSDPSSWRRSEQTGPELEMSTQSRALHIHALHDGELLSMRRNEWSAD